MEKRKKVDPLAVAFVLMTILVIYAAARFCVSWYQYIHRPVAYPSCEREKSVKELRKEMKRHGVLWCCQDGDGVWYFVNKANKVCLMFGRKG